MVETTVQGDAENLCTATTSSYLLASGDLYILHARQPCCSILLEHDREKGHSIPVPAAEAKHRALLHFRLGIKNRVLTSATIA